MRVTVLGASASYARFGGACAGYLIEGGGARVLFDCGNGALANLDRYMDPAQLDAVFITHAHPDHYADLYSLRALLRYAPGGPAAALPLFAPQGLFEALGAPLSEKGRTELAHAFAAVSIAHQQAVHINRLTVTPYAVEHVDPTFALRAESDSAVFAYSADSAPTGQLEAALRDADLALVDATLPEAYENMAPHPTAAQAGAIGRRAGVGSLVLTHIWPTADKGEAVARASEAFGSPVQLASEFEVFEIDAKGRVT